MTQFIETLFSVDKPSWWDDLYSDYLSARENTNSRYVLDLMKEIAYLSNQYFLTSKILEAMSLPGVYAPEFVRELKLMGHRGAFDPTNPEQYRADLKAAASSSKKIVTQLQRKTEELQQYQAKFGGNEISRQDFEDMATVYSKFLGTFIDFETTTVARWCSIASKYEAFCEVQNAQSNNMIKEKGYG